MTTYSVLSTYSQDQRPDGEGYAPQIVLTYDRHSFSSHALNTATLSFDDEYINRLYNQLDSAELVARFIRITEGFDCQVVQTNGTSQGDWGYSFIFAPQAWLDLTGAPGIQESDHNDFTAWLWGDVYNVYDSDNLEDPVATLYGYDQATKESKVLDEEELDELREAKADAEQAEADKPRLALQAVIDHVTQYFPRAKVFRADDHSEAFIALTDGTVISVTKDGHSASTETEWSTGFTA